MNTAIAWRTDRLDVRLLGGEDGVLYRSVYTDAQVMRHIGPALTIAEADRAFRQAIAGNHDPSRRHGVWVPVERAAGEAIGLLGLAREAGDAEIGILVLSPWQRRGLGREAVAGLIARVSIAAPVTGLRISHHRDNAAMAGLAASLGFVAMPDTDDGPWQRRRLGGQD